MDVCVSASLRATFDGHPIEKAPTLLELHAILGPPSRIACPATPPPVGHRHNQIHIYDQRGIAFFERHYTRRLHGAEIVFTPAVETSPFLRDMHAFAGTLEIAGQRLSSTTELRDFFATCPVAFKATMLGWIRAQQEDFGVLITVCGQKLPSGRRSKVLQLVSVSLSWPHDPWGEPAIVD